MRKMKFLSVALVLGLGIVVGTLGVSLLANPSLPGSFISKLRGQVDVQTVSGAVNGSTQTTPPPNTIPDTVSTTGSALSIANPDPAKNEANLQIIGDYKQDIGIFFEAWKSVDMNTFRLKLAKAYTGDLFEKHAKRAEGFLVQGIGLDVTQITFDQVDVESSDANTATLLVKYHYKAKDYSLTDGASFGEEHEQIVQDRVNLVKQNSRWMITGENTIQ